MFTKLCTEIFDKSISNYHITDNVDTPIKNPFEKGSIEALLYHKNWIDTVQWHLEDIIRDPNISPVDALKIKRRIDASNQERTDMVEYIDSYFLDKFSTVEVSAEAKVNTESPAWAIDRLSILYLKVYHMKEETQRSGASEKHIDACTVKYNTLKEQDTDLTTAIDDLLTDMEQGKKYMKVYKQMKMYNDEELNPVLYKGKK
ncbi:MAG: DUF4254 domain-containing protein [Ichthyobacteriaceae bacterium]|nr:DUF4254 domain-containing protein [Ichthyobacteriaceae bacterium]